MKNEILVDGIKYVPEIENNKKMAKKLDGLVYAVIRTYSAGCFSGYVKERKGKEGTILKARRFYYWSGAATLSQLAMEGIKNPEKCKFPCEVEELQLTDIIEVIPTTEQSKKSINDVKIWKM